MLEPPADLPDERIRASLQAAYGLAVSELTFLPLGHDQWAWVYRARTADGGDYFLKVRRHLTNHAALLIPRYLQDHGVARVIAPLPTVTGPLWAPAGDYALILYPFVEAQTGMMRGMSDQQQIEYGAVLRQIHATALSPDLAQIMRHESFTPDGADAVRRMDAALAGDADLPSPERDAPANRAHAPIWQTRRELIQTVLTRAEDLGRRLAARDPPLVLCHADIHTNNVLVDEADHQIWITDWDEVMLAPRERDLMFVLGGGISRARVTPRDEALFLAGYTQAAGTPPIDPLGLAYYRYAWAVSDIGAYGEQIFSRPDLGPATRQESVERFFSLFAPGNIVELALESDLSTS